MKVKVISVLALSAICSIALFFGGSSALAIVQPGQCDDVGNCGTSVDANLANNGESSTAGVGGGITGASLGTGGFDSYTRCWSTGNLPGGTWNYANGSSYELHGMHIWSKWCAKNSKITGSWTSVTPWMGGACAASDAKAFANGGGVGTAAIYIHNTIHAACNISFPAKYVVTWHYYPWIRIRYGVQGVAMNCGTNKNPGPYC